MIPFEFSLLWIGLKIVYDNKRPITIKALRRTIRFVSSTVRDYLYGARGGEFIELIICVRMPSFDRLEEAQKKELPA